MGITVKDLLPEERPRERLLSHGAQALSSQELLALLLSKGVKGESVLVTAQGLLSKFGSLEDVMKASVHELLAIRGLGVAKVTQLAACLEIARRISAAEVLRLVSQKQITTAEEVYYVVKSKLQDEHKEHLFVLCFDVRQRLLGIEVVSVGILDANIVHPREVFTCALKYHAASIILAHNHPSGDPQPSDEDFRVTERICEGGKLLGISVMDHVVVGAGCWVSLMERGNI